ncbi:hypothetical protein B0H14DRAFT_3492567 [Mycena olivaceomarginata]|nr:hypothetical protein B0H14DRAFT_3492567 [Mycena olivaceomarginata]
MKQALSFNNKGLRPLKVVSAAFRFLCRLYKVQHIFSPASLLVAQRVPRRGSSSRVQFKPSIHVDLWDVAPNLGLQRPKPEPDLEHRLPCYWAPHHIGEWTIRHQLVRQSSKCPTAWINSAYDFCLWAPSSVGTIGDAGPNEVAWCH